MCENTRRMLKLLVAVVGLCPAVYASTYTPNANIGVPAGLIPDCPGTLKNVTISATMLQRLQIEVRRLNRRGEVVRKQVTAMGLPKSIARDKSLNLSNGKTVVYACGFLDSPAFPHTLAVTNTLAKKGYNVLVVDTFSFLTKIYPISARVARTIGHKLGEVLAQLADQGLDAKNLELIGISLGAHIVSYAAKTFYKLTGKKPSRITGLDPAGPCFRSLDVSQRLNPDDADRVDVLHTNIDGFGMADPMGHVDFYANGGEFQPGDIPYIPCLVMCSHLRSLLYYWQALDHPRKFLAVECDSVQSARLARCYNNTVTNVLGLETDFRKPGIYYLPTNNEFPYYRGKEGLKAENEIYKYVITRINSEDNLVL